MQWTKPDFEEITLNMEVSAYVNTEESVRAGERRAVKAETAAPAPVADSSRRAN